MGGNHISVFTSKDLRKMQSWSLERKIQVAQTRIIDWYQAWNGAVYISFSGGKDSTVLLDLVRRIYPNIPAVFCDTGLEYPFDKDRPTSQPLSFWTNQDVLSYLRQFKIPYASIYGEIREREGELYTTGVDRTGCVFCGFGCHLDKHPNRFEKLKTTHPQLYEYCMKSIEDGGLGMDSVLSFIGVTH